MESNRAGSWWNSLHWFSPTIYTSSSHITPFPLTEKFLESFSLSMSSWKVHLGWLLDSSEKKTYGLYSCGNFFFSETATDLFNCRIHWGKLCLFHCLEIHMASEMAPNIELALREHLSLLMQKTGGSERYQCHRNRTGNSTKPLNQEIRTHWKIISGRKN